MTLQVYQNPVGDCHQLGGVQLPQADIAKATQPGLFDDLPESAFTVDHRLIINARPADRMLLCLALDVSPSAVKVAVALAYHGWNSWPSRERLCRLTNLKSPHVTRAANELEKAGVIARRRKYHTGGNVGIQYIFNGLALAKATVEQEHPTLQGAITNLVTAENAQRTITNLNRPRAGFIDHYQFGNGARERPEPEIDRDYQFGNGARSSPITKLNPEIDRDYQFGNGARERPEPEIDRDYQFGNGGRRGPGGQRRRD